MGKKILKTKYLSFRNKLMLSYILLLLIPVAVSGIYFYSNVLKSVQANSLKIIEQRLIQESDLIKNKILEIENTGNRISENDIMNKFFSNNYYGDADMIHAINNNIYPLISWFDATYSEVGNIRFLTDNESIPENKFIGWERRFAKSDWLATVKSKINENEQYWDDLHLHREFYWDFTEESQNKLYSYFHKLSKNDSLYTTYLEIETIPEYLFSTINSLSIYQTGYSLIIDSELNILAGEKTDTFDELLDFADFTSRLTQDDNSFNFEHKNKDYFIDIKKIEQLGSYIVSIIPMKEITQPVTKFKNYFFLIFFFGSIFIGIIAYFTAGFLLKRIKKIVEAVRKIQNEDFNINIPIQGRDEIEELAQDVNIMSSKISDLINKVYKAEILQKETALNALQSQMNPHFIFNTLETIRMMAEIKNEDEISRALIALGSLLRYNIMIDKNFVTVESDIENIKNYIKIQNLMLNNRLNIEYDINPSMFNFTIPSFILQPIVENSILHGFKNKENGLSIRISLRKVFDSIFISVSDNGDGIDKDRLSIIKNIINHGSGKETKSVLGDSIGLKNINERIKLYFGNTYGIKIYSYSNGVMTLAKLPIMINQD